MASPLWLAVGPRVFIRRIIYKFLNVCPFDYTIFAVSGKIGIPKIGLTTPVVTVGSCRYSICTVAVVTPSDHPKSVRNRCVIEVFGGVFVLSHCFLDFSVDVEALS